MMHEKCMNVTLKGNSGVQVSQIVLVDLFERITTEFSWALFSIPSTDRHISCS